VSEADRRSARRPSTSKNGAPLWARLLVFDRISGSALADDRRGGLLGLGATGDEPGEHSDGGNAENNLFHLNDPG